MTSASLSSHGTDVAATPTLQCIFLHWLVYGICSSEADSEIQIQEMCNEDIVQSQPP